MKLSKLRVPELRKQLKARGLDEKGNRPILIKRLREALEESEQNAKAKAVDDNHVDPHIQDGEELITAGESHADSIAQQSAADDIGSAKGRSKTGRTYKRKLEDKVEPEDRSPKRQYKANGSGGNGSSAARVTRRASSPPRRQYRSKTAGEESAVHDEPQADRTPVQEQPRKAVEQAGVDSSSAPEVGKNGVNNPDRASTGDAATIGQPNNSGSPSKNLESVEPKSAGSIQSADDAASFERIRRRKERFGIVIKEAAGGDPTDEEAVRKRRARFGAIAVMNNSAKIPQAAQQERDEAALRRRAEKFGLNAGKRVPTDTGLPKDEIEKRLRRQKRFQSVS